MCDNHLPRSATRRDVLRGTLAAAGIVALGPLGRLVPAAHGAVLPLSRLVVINCFGGNDTLNMLVPTTLAPYHDQRPGLSLAPEECLSLDAGPAATQAYALHPSMPNLARLWADGQVAAVNRVGYPNANLSHFTSQDIFSSGVRGSFHDLGIAPSGWIARYADRYAPTPLGAVSVGVGRPKDFVGGSSNPLLVSSLAGFRISKGGKGGGSDSPAYRHRLRHAQEMLARFPGSGLPGEARAAIDQAHGLADQIQAAVAGYQGAGTYSNVNISRYLKDVATLIQAGFETRIFYTGLGGFDSHGGQGTTTGIHATLLGRIDEALGAFEADMRDMGTWNRIVVAIVTEFGRRNFVNGSSGTDHGHAFAVLLVGGAVRGGLYGPDLVEADLTSSYPAYAVDFRSIYKEILSGHLGADPDEVFPEPLERETVLGIV